MLLEFILCLIIYALMFSNYLNALERILSLLFELSKYNFGL